jgi:hypothetical protein
MKRDNPPPSFIDAPSPCDACRQAERCAAELRACSQFSLFINGASATRWRAAPKAASTAIYSVLFDPA